VVALRRRSRGASRQQTELTKRNHLTITEPISLIGPVIFLTGSHQVFRRRPFFGMAVRRGDDSKTNIRWRVGGQMTTWFKTWKARRRRGNASRSVRKLSFSAFLRAEALEDRLLPSLAPPQLLLDINPGTAPSFPKSFTQVNNLVFFSANDGMHGPELWASDGTAAGTFLVLDINPGTGGSNPNLLTNVNGTLFFQANDGTHGVELWESNGTAAGTFLVNDTYPGSNGGYPSALTNVNGTLFFSANDGTHGDELWRSDGTAAGTFLVADINRSTVPNQDGSYPEFMANVNGTLFFNATDGTHGTELWRSDGTAAGTSMVEDILPGPNGSSPNRLTNVNGTLFFSANDGTHGLQLWESNGTAAGTFLVKDIINGSGPSAYPYYLTNVNGSLFFSAEDAAHGDELWASNGTTAGTAIVADIDPGPGTSFPQYLTNVGGTVFFMASDGTHGKELWESNGSAAGTFLVKDINPGAANGYALRLTNGNGTLFFEANDGTHGFELWESNGTAAGTSLVADINPGSGGSYLYYPANVAGALLFGANDGTHGVEPWILPLGSRIPAVSSSPDPSGLGEAVTFTASFSGFGPAPTGTVDFKEGSTDLTPGGVNLVAGQASFSTSNLAIGSHTIPAFYSGDTNFPASQADDSANPQVVGRTKLLLDINPFLNQSSNPNSFTQVNNLTFFAASDFTNGTELWASDGSPAGTFLVKDINRGSANSYPKYLLNVNGTLFFQANDGADGAELWESNGTAAGTFLVDDINPGVSGSYPKYLLNVNGTLFFQANDGTHGNALWESNGTSAGTFLVQNISPSSLTNVNGTLFFDADDGTHGIELWESNGTAAGTFMVDDINPGMSGSNPASLTNVNGILFFAANDGTHGVELWESNGTAAGTFLVADINPGSSSSYPAGLANVNGIVFFAANDGTNGIELWKSNGSAAGTLLVKDINAPNGGNPRFYSSFPKNLTNVNGILFFSAFRFIEGTELWESDGTAAGTFLVKDINPGIGPDSTAYSSNPSGLTNVNGTLFFEATDRAHGSELWESNGSGAGTFLVQDIQPGRFGSYPGGLTNVNGNLFFSADDFVHGTEPWIVVSTATLTSVSSTPNPLVVGHAVTFTAMVAEAVPGLPALTGTVDFKEGSTDLTPGGVTVVGGQATFSTNALAIGSHTITAIYSGDINFHGSQGDDSASPQVVNDKIVTNGLLLSAPLISVFGQAVNFLAVVTPAAPGTPTGTVDFKDGSTDLTPGGVTLASGRATFSTASFSVGSHTITASYSGDSNFKVSTASSIQIVHQAATATALTSSTRTTVSGEQVVFRATVRALAPGTGIPTGTVDFKDGATDLTPGGVTLSAGEATFSTTALAVGSHTITALYSGNADFTASQVNDAATPLVVKKDPSHTVLTSFPNPAVFGQVVSFTVIVRAVPLGSGTPTGTVTFLDGTKTLGSLTLDSTARATFSTASLSRGNHAINVNYSGDGHFLASADTNFGEAVLQDATTTTVSSSANPAVVGTGITLTASVQASLPGAGTPTGTVTFRDISTVFGTATLNGAGKATFSTSTLALGTHAISASYAGDTNFQSSFSPSIAEVVKASVRAALVSPSPMSSARGPAPLAAVQSDPPAHLLVDINPGSANSSPGLFTQVDNLVFFSAFDPTHRRVLWASDGTAAGTFVVQDSGSVGFYPQYLTNVNGTLFFQARESSHGRELWESNGTAAGTFLVKDINPGASDSKPYDLTNVNGTLFFDANDGTHGAELWESNGTAAGTFLVDDINPGSANAYPNSLTNVNGTLFFKAFDSTHGRELWESNGSTAGTFLVKPGIFNFGPYFPTNVNGTLFFDANDGTHGFELWESNGTAAGTFLVKDINPGTSNSYASYLTNVSGTLFFGANDGTHGFELWESNGSAAGTFLVKDINPGTSNSYPKYLTNVRGTLFFGANDGTHGVELWESNGTAAGTFLVKDINPGATNSLFKYSNLTNVNGTLFFSANDGTHGFELWQSNGSAAGTFLVQDINPGSGNSYPNGLTNVNGALFFSANDGVHGFEPWILGNPQGPRPFVVNQLLDINPGSASSNPTSFTRVNNLTFFAADDGTHGVELWASNGSAAGTYLVKDINPGAGNSYPNNLTNLNGTLFFLADDGSGRVELWESNGTTAGTVLVKSTGAAYPSSPYLTNANGTLFFTTDDGTNGGFELWGSNGTTAGTVVVKDINPAQTVVSIARRPANVNGTLFFDADDGTHGIELWESNGSAAGTFLVKDINPGQSASYPAYLTNVNGTLFFRADDGTHGFDLWESNGSASGTFLVKDINPGSISGGPYSPANVNGTLFFAAIDGTHGFELWESNGTAAGTFLVKDINPGTNGSYANFLTNVNGTLFFEANDGTHGFELWESNGSAAGTFLVKDINPGVSDSLSINPKQPYFTNVSGTLFFAADDGTHGFELWESNGSAAGTVMVQDIDPGSANSYPEQLTNVSGALFFSADDGVHGREPWILASTATTTRVSSAPNPSRLGQAATFTATIGVAPGLPAPTGSVDFKEGSTDLTPGGVFVVGGQATFSTTALVIGSNTITAIYSGDSNFPGSQGDDSASPQVVNKDGTGSLLVSVPGTTVFGQPAAFFAFVTAADPAAGTPTGTVTFKEGTTVLATNVTLSGGSASFTTASLSVGSHTITAVYSGDSHFTVSQADDSASPQLVSKDGTSMALTSSTRTTVSGEQVVFRATVRAVAPGTGIPAGTVDFKDGATDLTPGGVTLSAGAATFSTTALAVGSHTITANYSGSAGFTASQVSDAASPLVVNKDPSHTVLTAFPNPAVFGQVVTFTVIVRSVPLGSGTPTGRVTFLDGTTTLGSTGLVNGQGTFPFSPFSNLSRGNHAITANYTGDGNFLASADANFGEAVLQDATTTTVTASANPAVVGTAITFTASVQPSVTGHVTPTGTVTFKDFTTTLGTATLNSAGKATFSTSTLALGTHAISAGYGGDTNFLSSFSPSFSEVIKASVQAALVSSPPTSSTRPLAAQTSVQSAPVHGLNAQSVDDLFAASGGRRRSTPLPAAHPHPAIRVGDWLDLG
jgi:ELWxxDGT repeat protein